MVYAIPPAVVASVDEPSAWLRWMDREDLNPRPGLLEDPAATVDWDDVAPNPRVVWRIWRAICLQYDPAGVAQYYRAEWRPSASGRGVHLRLRLPLGTLSPYRILATRAQFGDDRVRLTFDAYRWRRSKDPTYLRGILFDAKHSDDGFTLLAGRWRPLIAPP